MKIFKTRTWGIEIEELESVRETEASYFIMRGKKEVAIRKSNSYENYFKTRLEAIDHIKNRLKSEIDMTKYKLTRLEKELSDVR